MDHQATTLAQITELLQHLFNLHQAGTTTPCLLLVGESGIGKTQLLADFCRPPGQLITLAPSLFESPADLLGFPQPNAQTGRMDHLPPSFLPAQSPPAGQPAILLIDDLMRCPTFIQDALMRLIYDRRLGHYLLPEAWMICATSNTIPSDPAFRSRCLIHQVEFDLPTWIDYLQDWLPARELSFVQHCPELINQGANPREFTFFFQLIQGLSTEKLLQNQGRMLRLCGSNLPPETVNAFYLFLQHRLEPLMTDRDFYQRPDFSAVLELVQQQLRPNGGQSARPDLSRLLIDRLLQVLLSQPQPAADQVDRFIKLLQLSLIPADLVAAAIDQICQHNHPALLEAVFNDARLSDLSIGVRAG